LFYKTAIADTIFIKQLRAIWFQIREFCSQVSFLWSVH